MKSLQIYSFESPRIISWGDSVVDALIEALNQNEFDLQDGDIISVTSKVISMEENSAVQLSEIKPTQKAHDLAKSSKMDPRVVQVILDESGGEIFGSVYHAILAKTRYGLSANAGIDLSNCPEGFALLLPRDPDKTARKIRNYLRDRLGVDVAVLITDSRTIPLKKGTFAVTLGISGMDPLIDERGKKDLYGYKMAITTRAVADNVATATNLLMGETDERTPFAVLRGFNYPKDSDVSMEKTLMPENECLYFSPLLKYRGEKHD